MYIKRKIIIDINKKKRKKNVKEKREVKYLI
jgi:hypothetical protein